MFTDRKVVDDSAYNKDNREAGLHGYLFNSFTKGDFQLLQMMYNKLKLNDNKRLLTRMNSGNKIFSNITESIYHDIIGLIIEEVIYKGNDEARLLLEDYAIEKYRLNTNIKFRKWICASEYENHVYNDIYFNLLNDCDKNYGYAAGEFLSYLHFTYCHSVLSLSKDANPWDLIKNNPSAHVKLNSLDAILEQRLGTEKLSESKLFQRFIDKCKERYKEEYFDTEDSDELSLQFFINYNITGGTYDINTLETMFLSEGMIEDRVRFTYQMILESNGLSNLLLSEQDKETIERLFNQYFDMACKAQLACRAQSDDIVMSNIMRKAEMDISNVNTEILSYYYIDKLCKMINQLQEKRYQSFSFGGENGKSDEQILIEENIQLTEQIVKMKSQMIKQSEEINVIKEQLNRQTRVEERPYIEQIGELEKKILRLNNEIEEQIKIRDSQNQYIELLQRKDEVLKNDEVIIYEKLQSVKPMFVGGLSGVINVIKDYFGSYKWISNETGRCDISGVTHIIMFYDNMNHALFYKVINIARNNDLPVIYCKGTNNEKILGYICTEI